MFHNFLQNWERYRICKQSIPYVHITRWHQCSMMWTIASLPHSGSFALLSHNINTWWSSRAPRRDEAPRHLCGRVDVNKFPELWSSWSAPRSAAHYFSSPHFSWTIFSRTHTGEPAHRLHNPGDLGSLIQIRIIPMECRLFSQRLHPLKAFSGRVCPKWVP